MKVFERIIENLLRDKVDIGSMQFGFMPGKGTTDAIFVVHQVQERFMDKKRPLFFAFVDLEKVFDRVPHAVLEWSLRELIVDDWLIKVIMSMDKNARSLVRVNGKLGEEFEVKEGVHQGSVLSPILFASVLEALSCGFNAGLPWELLYADDDLVIMADSLDELSVKLERWKVKLSAKGLKVNTKKTKTMISKPGAGPVQKTGKYPCSVCSKCVGSNSIQCTKCKQWVHARCSRVKGKLAEVKDFVCNSCSSPPLDTCEEEENIAIGNSSYEAVQQCCYLGDMISAGEASSATRTRCAWKKFRELLLILSSHTFSLKKTGSFYQACVRPVLLYGSETWPVKVEDLVRLHHTEMSMLRWMSHATFKDRIPSNDLLTKFDLLPVRRVVQRNRLRWFGHVVSMDNDNWVKKCMTLEVNGRRDPGRPKKTWEQVIASDLCELGVTRSLAQDRLNWRKTIVMHSLTHASME